MNKVTPPPVAQYETPVPAKGHGIYVASLELSRELERLSGWNDTPLVWVEGFKDPYTAPRTPLNGENTAAFDLGYLLRKLDDDLTGEVDLTSCRHYEGSRNWCASDGNGVFSYQDAPEDAVANVAIQLFRRGVLTRDES